MKNLISTLNEFYPLSKQSLEQLNSIFVEKKYKKKDKLASFGEVPTNFFVLKSEDLLRYGEQTFRYKFLLFYQE